jgi:hypothetical protein
LPADFEISDLVFAYKLLRRNMAALFDDWGRLPAWKGPARAQNSPPKDNPCPFLRISLPPRTVAAKAEALDGHFSCQTANHP